MAALAFVLLRPPLAFWLEGEDRYDREALIEWVREARVYQTLPELVSGYVELKDRYRELETRSRSDNPAERPTNDDLRTAKRLMDRKREQIEVHLRSLCDPVAKVYPGRLPLFVTVYRMTVTFDESLGGDVIEWDSLKPRQPKQYHELKDVQIHPRGVTVEVDYQLRVYARQQYYEREAVARWRWLAGVGLILAAIAGLWFYLALRQRRDREMRRLRAEQQVSEAERLRLAEALRREEAERKQQDAERTALELRSQVFANIGIMAGSYAHNIKNLLVRPNDLLGRCLEQDGLSPEQGHMLSEVRQTLGTVTERLQQILQTVRRDPGQARHERVDLSALARDLVATWGEMARDKWKLAVTAELAEEPLWVEGDPSHLQQAVENLLFNARDATFEMRNHLREQARKGSRATADAAQERRQALIAAAAWKGQVWLRTRREGDRAVLEVEDNGIGMTEEVRRRCTETHFSTKRDNALFAGLTAGMGLGLSFVQVILEHHGAKLEIASEPLDGARFQVSLPATA
jgi:signal transduction histidine kinase